ELRRCGPVLLDPAVRINHPHEFPQLPGRFRR
ncbi:hypothetical protein, partial [Escherichia coli]